MANWQRTLDISDNWDKLENGLMSIHDISKEISKKLSELAPFNIPSIDNDKNGLIEMFNDLSESEDHIEYLTEDFDRAMTQLYDWGDIELGNRIAFRKRVCFIKVLN